MNPNVWNIKEILSIPASRNASTSGYSTDSQFMLGSQSQETLFSSRNSHSQQSSEGSDPTFLNNYHTKPLLFGVDGKDVQKRAIGVLEKFEEDKRRTKERRESDFLAKERHHLRETLIHMQHSVNDTEKNTAACKTVLEGFDSFATALQKNLSSLHNGITQQFEKMLSEMGSQKQLLTEIEENVLKTGVASTELGSLVKGLEKNMEVMAHERRREQNTLEEAVTLLNTLVSKHSAKPIPVRVTDSTSQTSPGLTVSTIQTSSPGMIDSMIQTSPGLTDSMIQTSPGLSQTLFNQEQERQPEDKRRPLCQIENSQDEVPSQNQGSRVKRKSRTTAPQSCKINKRRPLLPPQRRKGTIRYEKSQTPTYDVNPQGVSSPHDPKGLVGIKPEPRSRSLIDITPDRQLSRLVDIKQAPQSKSRQQSRETRSNTGRGSFIIPFNVWSQESRSSPAAIETALPAEREAGSKSRQQSRETRSNTGKGSFITPFDVWSQESSSSPAAIETALPAEREAGISEKPKGLWQLFDLCHSDPFSVDEE